MVDAQTGAARLDTGPVDDHDYDSLGAVASDAARAVSDVKSSYGATPLTAVFGVGVWYYAMWVLIQRLMFLGNYNEYLPAALQKLFPVPPIDAKVYTGEPAPLVPAAIQNTLLILLFAVPYAAMSRKAFKQWATANWYPQAIERSVLLLVSSACLHLQMRNWVPMTQTVFTLPRVFALAPLLGYGLIIAATINVDHLSFFGLKQAIGIPHKPHLVKSGVYRFVRHPLMVGELITWWVYSHMTRGRLLFAVLNTAFLLLRAKVLEEPDLVATFGGAYKDFLRKTPAFIPKFQADEVVNPDKPLETAQNVANEILGGTKLE